MLQRTRPGTSPAEPETTDQTDGLVLENPLIMGGLACFRGTRVPIDMVLGSLDEGLSLAEVRQHYSFVTEAHVASARSYIATHPNRRLPRAPGDVPTHWRLVEDFDRPVAP